MSLQFQQALLERVHAGKSQTPLRQYLPEAMATKGTQLDHAGTRNIVIAA